MQVGKILQRGKYTLEQEIGRGGFGITFKATHHYLNQPLVIKTLNESLRQDPEFTKFQRSFQDEARRLAACVHPHIVRVSDFFIEDSLPYMVMDYIPGQTLDKVVFPNHPLKEAIAIHYISQIAAALQTVHQNNLLHRDVKPENIIRRDGTEQVVLIDFGIAREFTPGSTQTHTGMVSEGYAPIEQYLTHAPRTPATDVYGLAATLYTLLTAKVPIAASLRDRVPMPAPRDLQPHLSVAVNQAVMRGMAVEARFRPATIAQWLSLLPTTSSHVVAKSRSRIPQTSATLAVAQSNPPASIPPRAKNALFRSLLIGGGVAVVGAIAAVALSAVFSTLEQQSTDIPVIQPSSEPSTNIDNGTETSPPIIENRDTTPPAQTLDQPPQVSPAESPQPTSIETPAPNNSPVPIESPTPSVFPSPVETPPLDSQIQPSVQPSPPQEAPPPVVVETLPPVIVDTESSQGEDEFNDDSKRQRRNQSQQNERKKEKRQQEEDD